MPGLGRGTVSLKAQLRRSPEPTPRCLLSGRPSREGKVSATSPPTLAHVPGTQAGHVLALLPGCGPWAGLHVGWNWPREGPGAGGGVQVGWPSGAEAEWALCHAACGCHLLPGFGFLELVPLQVDFVRPGDLTARSLGVSEPDGGWVGGNNEAFPQESRAEPAVGRQSACTLGLTGLLAVRGAARGSCARLSQGSREAGPASCWVTQAAWTCVGFCGPFLGHSSVCLTLRLVAGGRWVERSVSVGTGCVTQGLQEVRWEGSPLPDHLARAEVLWVVGGSGPRNLGSDRHTHSLRASPLGPLFPSPDLRPLLEVFPAAT